MFVLQLGFFSPRSTVEGEVDGDRWQVVGLKDKPSQFWGISTTQVSRFGRKYGRKGNIQILEPVCAGFFGRVS